MAWTDILKNFRDQFQAMGPEKYSNIDNPDARYQLAAQRTSGLKSGVATAAGVISQNVQESQKAAASAAKAKAAQGYTKAYNKSGGYDFFDTNGKPVSAFEYSLANGEPLTKALEGSYDQGDRNFLEDYSAMSEDLASGRYDQKQALQVLAKDYPTMFGMATPAAQGNQTYQAERTQVDTSSNAGKLVNDYANKIGKVKTYEDANKLLDKLRASNKNFRKLSAQEQQDVIRKLGRVTDTFFPPKGQGMGMGLY